MNRDSEKYRLLIENLPDAFAYHQIITDDDGTPVDYIFLEVNDAFEEMTGLKREKIIGKNVTEILPGIEKSEFDWIGIYGKVASSGKPVRFESFFELLGRWYEVSAYSNEPGYFSVVFHNTTSQKQLETEIIKTKKRYQMIVDTQHEMICHYLPDTALVFVNKAYCRTFGLSEPELIGRKFLEHTPPDYREELVAIISKLTPEQPFIIHEHQAVLPDGTLCWQEWTDQAIFNETGELLEYQAVGRDITDRKQAEEKLKKIEWMLSQKQTPESIEQADAYNQGYGDLIELNNGGVILNSIGPELLKSFSNDYLELLGTSSAIYEINGDYAFGIFASGWCRMMDKASRNLCNTPDNIEALSSGRWLCHESCWTDCSQKAILESTQVDIECNGGIRLYAVPIIASGEVVGAINFGYGDPPEDREKLQKLANTYQENYDDLVREAHAYETRPPYIIDMAKKRLHATARLIGSMIEKKQAEDLIRTINEELEERVRERTAQLETANRELDAFTYSASHDLRGPLNRISGFSNILLEDYAEVLDTQGRDYLQRITNSSHHMGELIDDLLKLSKVSQHQISCEPVELSVLVKIYLKELQAGDPDRQVEMVIAPGLIAEADTALIRIALENLLGNAWKYTAGEALSRIEFGSTSKEDKEVYYIRDNGTGFDMKHAKKLFTPFQRLHDTEIYPGTGIGLSIVARIIHRHSGKIWAEGEPGKGACFFFTLPK